MFETLSREQLNAMTSDQYKQNFEGPSGDDFRKRVSELENAPRTATRPRGSVRGEEVAPTPAETSFDPSFDDAPAPAAAPATVEPAPAPAATVDESLPELIHEYQPVDRNGRPVGGKQLFRYRTQEELIQKLTAAHMASSARIRELSRDRKLDELASAGTINKVPVPSDKVPETMEELATELRSVRESNYFLAVRAAIADFTASAGWNKYRSKENAESIVLAVTKAGDDPTDVQSYHKAFAAMKAFIEPVAQSVVAATVDSTPAPVVEQPATPAVRPANAARVATGISNADVFNNEDNFEVAPAKVQGQRLVIDEKTVVMDLRTWDRQTSDFQKRVLRNPNNARAVNAMYEEQQQAQLARRR